MLTDGTRTKIGGLEIWGERGGCFFTGEIDGAHI